MALSMAQKEFLLASIEHLLDFSTDREILIDEIAAVKLALQHSVDPSHPFYFLGKCYKQPQEMLRGLEKYNADQQISVIDVQLSMLEFIDEAIDLAAKKAALDLNDAIWPVNSFKDQTLSSAEGTAKFVSIHRPVEPDYFPWENMHTEDSLFKASLFLYENSNFVSLKIKLTLPDSDLNIIVEEFSKLPFYGAEAEDTNYDSLMSMIPKAKRTAMHISAKYLIEYLIKEAGFRDSILIKQSFLDSFNIIITDSFYFNLLLDEKILVRKLAFLSDRTLEKLLNPTIKSLLRAHIITFKDIKYFNHHAIDTAKKYYLLLLNKKISLDEIKDLTSEQCKILSLPIVNNLINMNSLLFHEAKKLPVCIIPLLSSELYMDLLLRTPVKWQRLAKLSAEDCTFLLEPSIALLIKNDVFTLEQTRLLYPELRAALLQKTIYDLMLKKAISIHDFALLSPDSIQLLLHHPHLRTWLSNRIISCETIELNNLQQLYAEVYAERLYAACKQLPYKPYGVTDTMPTLLQELPAAAYHAKISWQVLREQILDELIVKFRTDINEKALKAEKASDRKFFRYLRMQILHALKHQITFVKALAEIIEVAQIILKEMNTEKASFTTEPKKFLFSLFTRHHPANIAETREFCMGIIMLGDFINPEIEEKVIPKPGIKV